MIRNITWSLDEAYACRLDIDEEKGNICYGAPGYSYIEAILAVFKEHYNPLRDFQPVSRERAEELNQKYKFFDLIERRINLSSYDIQVQFATLDYIDKHPNFPVALWPETGMYLTEQECFLDLLRANGINKYLFITNSIFFTGGKYDDELKSYEIIERKEDDVL